MIILSAGIPLTILKKCHSLLEFTSFNCMQQLKSTENCCGNVLDIGLTNIDAVSVMPSNVHLVVPEPSFNCFFNSGSTETQHPFDNNTKRNLKFSLGDYVGLYHYLKTLAGRSYMGQLMLMNRLICLPESLKTARTY